MTSPTNREESILSAILEEGALEETIEAGELVRPEQQGNASADRTPGAAGHPEPGSGHDDSKTVTVEDGPPIRKTVGEPGAFGNLSGDSEPVTDIFNKPGLNPA